jgi:hypothetical protein
MLDLLARHAGDDSGLFRTRQSQRYIRLRHDRSLPLLLLFAPLFILRPIELGKRPKSAFLHRRHQSHEATKLVKLEKSDKARPIFHAQAGLHSARFGLGQQMMKMRGERFLTSVRNDNIRRLSFRTK